MFRRQHWPGGWINLAIGFGILAMVLRPTVALSAGELDNSLRTLLAESGISQLPPLPQQPAAKVELGQLLFFDKELSGNRDIACATCHHPQLATGDARSLPIGTKGEGLGAARQIAAGRDFVPRNSPEIFHRGHEEIDTMFWDSRVAQHEDRFESPAKEELPNGLDNVLAVQAMFPVTSRAEMRGNNGDHDVRGVQNEVANIDDDDLATIWGTLANRLMAIPEYQQRFAEVYPDVPTDEVGFEHAANAIAAFEAQAFAPTDSAWDRYVAGDNDALTDAAKRGAHVFFEQGNCASCHAGTLMTDQEHHNIGVPQLGPGKEGSAPLDTGRALQTGTEEEEFAFRTPPLRNVAATGPWMHNGAYSELQDAIQHYSDPTEALRDYDISQLDESLQATVQLSEDTVARIVATLDDRVLNGPTLTGEQLDDVTAFLFSLTSPSLDQLLDAVPDSVPSGLPVDQLLDGPASLLYDQSTGELTISASGDLMLSSLFLRLPEGEDFEFDFPLGQAAWSGDDDIVLSDDLRAQSFFEYRPDQPFSLGHGDSVGQLLPPLLSQEDLDRYLTVVYTEGGNAVLMSAGVVAIEGLTVGDLNRDALVTAADIDLLSAAVRDGNTDDLYDLNADGNVDDSDRVFWVETLATTFLGDADLNRQVDFADFLTLSDHYLQLGGWAEGDFDGNGLVELADFLALTTNYGQSKVVTTSVPEPSHSLSIVCVSILSFAKRRRRLIEATSCGT